jgi:hypothetical protein
MYLVITMFFINKLFSTDKIIPKHLIAEEEKKSLAAMKSPRILLPGA